MSPPSVNEQQLSNTLKANKEVVYIFSKQEAYSLWLMEMERNGTISAAEARTMWERVKTGPEVAANYAAVADDIWTMRLMAVDFGKLGARCYVKTYGGKEHIILKGYAGLRQVLNAPKYGIKNPKIVKMGIGKYGAINSVKSGAMLTIVLVTAYRVIDYFLSDSVTLNELLGTLATDFIKVGISAAAAIGAVHLVAGTAIATFAMGPLAVAVLVGVGVGIVVNKLDEDYEITKSLIAALDDVSASIAAKKRQVEEGIIDTGRRLAEETADAVVNFAVRRTKEYIIKNLRDLFWQPVLPRF